MADQQIAHIVAVRSVPDHEIIEAQVPIAEMEARLVRLRRTHPTAFVLRTYRRTAPSHKDG